MDDDEAEGIGDASHAVAALVDIETVLAPIADTDRWGRAVRERLALTDLVGQPAVAEVLVVWSTATGTSPTKTWLRRDDDLRDRLPGGEVPMLADLLLLTFLDTTLAGDEHEDIKRRGAAAYELLRTLRREREARVAGTLRYLGNPEQRPVDVWMSSVTPRVDALPAALRPGALFGLANAHLLRGAVWAVAHHPSDPATTAELLASVAEHGVHTNAGLEPGTEVVQAGKVVNAAIAMLATLPGEAGRGALDRLTRSITNGHHAKQIVKALAALA